MKPNLFNYATGELSQDAMLCWMFDWANTDHSVMRPFAMSILKFIFMKHQYKFDDVNDVIKIEIKKQHKNIDVLILVHFPGRILPIIIEDKTNSLNHSNQLQTYMDAIQEECETNKSMESPLGVYYKTGYLYSKERNEANENGYIVMGKPEIASLIEPYSGRFQCDILEDYYQYIVELIEREKSLLSILEENHMNRMNDLLKTREGQWMFLENIFGERGSKNQYNGTNPNGSPWTQYKIMPGGQFDELPDALFYRLDRRSNGYYLAMRQYLKFSTGTKDYSEKVQLKKVRLKILKECFSRALRTLTEEHGEVLEQGNESNRGTFESEIGVFFIGRFNTFANLIEWIPRFNYFFIKEVEERFDIRLWEELSMTEDTAEEHY